MKRCYPLACLLLFLGVGCQTALPKMEAPQVSLTNIDLMYKIWEPTGGTWNVAADRLVAIMLDDSDPRCEQAYDQVERILQEVSEKKRVEIWAKAINNPETDSNGRCFAARRLSTIGTPYAVDVLAHVVMDPATPYQVLTVAGTLLAQHQQGKAQLVSMNTQ